MAENKKSFLLYCDLIHTIEELTDDEAGKLFKHVLRYVNDRNPEAPDRITKIAFEPIKQALKRDLTKYEVIREKKRLAGIASAESRKRNQHLLTPVDSVEREATHSTVNDSVSVIDSVSDNDIKENDIVDLWNTLCSPPLAKVEKLTKSRKSKLSIRIKEIGGKSEIESLFNKIKVSKFLNGDNVKNWKATFDWVFENDKNWVKIVEGNYDSHDSNSQQPNTSQSPPQSITDRYKQK